MIGVDWGTTNFRAFRISAEGSITARRSSPQGVLSIPAGQFPEMLRSQVGDWLTEGETQIMLCGMVGSRHGWVEAPYVSCPVGAIDLARSVIRLSFFHAEVFLIPGVAGAAPSGQPEVMRGEETATIGVLESTGGEGLICLPGTHSKWVEAKGNKILRFSTFMTGELFATLRSSTILSQLMKSKEVTDLAAFRRGVERSSESSSLLHHLFSVRTLTLRGDLQEDCAASYLSGLLIGHEVRSAIAPHAIVHLLGTESLCGLYTEAIRMCGGDSHVGDTDAAVRGMLLVSRMLAIRGANDMSRAT